MVNWCSRLEFSIRCLTSLKACCFESLLLQENFHHLINQIVLSTSALFIKSYSNPSSHPVPKSVLQSQTKSTFIFIFSVTLFYHWILVVPSSSLLSFFAFLPLLACLLESRHSISHPLLLTLPPSSSSSMSPGFLSFENLFSLSHLVFYTLSCLMQLPPQPVQAGSRYWRK